MKMAFVAFVAFVLLGQSHALAQAPAPSAVPVQRTAARPTQPPPPALSNPSPLAPGALPIAYDPNWNHYTGLTRAQIAAYEAFPQDLAIYASHKRFLAAHAAITPAATAAAITAAVNAAYATEATALVGVNATPPTITTRAQIDTAFKP